MNHAKAKEMQREAEAMEAQNEETKRLYDVGDGTLRKLRLIDVYVPVCVTMLIDESDGSVIHSTATGARVDSDGMPWANLEGEVWDLLTETWHAFPVNDDEECLEDTDAGEVAYNLVDQALETLDFPDADLAERWLKEQVR